MSMISSRLEGRIGRLTLDRPESRNAISKQMWLDIPAVIAELERGGAELIVIEGAGDSFAAGADIMELKDLENESDVQSNWEAIAEALNFIYALKLPSIAAIDGPCMGGGCLLACACDLRYASRRSKFAVPIAKLGIALDDANLGRLASLVGVGKAKELVFRAQIVSASEAESIGLINATFDDHEFNEKIAEILSQICANSLLSIQQAKESFSRLFEFSKNADNEGSVLRSYLGEDFRNRIKRALNKE